MSSLYLDSLSNLGGRNKALSRQDYPDTTFATMKLDSSDVFFRLGHNVQQYVLCK